MIRLEPLTQALLEQALANVSEPFGVVSPDFISAALRDPTIARALLDGDVVLCAGGIVPHWHGRAETWFIATKHARPRHVVAALRACRAYLDVIQCVPEYRRVEAWVRSGQSWSRFPRTLGMEPEGYAEAWGPDGEDYRLWARIGKR